MRTDPIMLELGARKRLSSEIICAEMTDGTPVTIRAIQASDERLMREGIGQLSAESRYFRFFSPQPVPTDSVIQNLVNVDGYNHIAWGALLTDSPDHPAIGAVHVFRDGTQNATGELSFAIADAYHGLGLARILMAFLLTHCRLVRIETLAIHVLSENRAAASLIRTLGAKRSTTPAAVSDYEVNVDQALDNLCSQTGNTGLQAVLKRLAKYQDVQSFCSVQESAKVPI